MQTRRKAPLKALGDELVRVALVRRVTTVRSVLGDRDMHEHWIRNDDLEPYHRFRRSCWRMDLIHEAKYLVSNGHVKRTDLQDFIRATAIIEKLYGISYQLHIGEWFGPEICFPRERALEQPISIIWHIGKTERQ